jgi:hypothetical protein
MLRPKRTEGDQDSDGWSTVKPRKSFGTEGAERFNGRMGVDRHKDDRRFKDREDRDMKERSARGFETFSREKEVDPDQEKEPRRNGAGRGRNESWFRGDNEAPLPPAKDRNSNGERFVDRSRGWREKDRDDRGDKGVERNDRNDRRWDRNDRQEREPEWLDEPYEEKSQAHTQEDFQKWKEQMQGKDKTDKTPVEELQPKVEAGGQGSFFGLEKGKAETPLTIDTGPDKFFGMWSTPKDENGPESAIESKKEGATKAKSGGKASRFTSFFTPQDEPAQRQIDQPSSIPSMSSGFGATSEKEAFQQLLEKLHHQTLEGSGSTPPVNASQQPKPPAVEQQSNPLQSSETFLQYRSERQDEGRPTTRNSQQQALQDLLSQRQIAGSQPTVRPDQMLQEIVGQRQNALSQSSVRPDQPQNRSNKDFLMNLMNSAKITPEPPRTEQLMMRMPPNKPIDRQIQQQIMEREQEMHREALARERSVSQRQARPPPGFYDDPAGFQRGPPQHERPLQPTHILQRPPPPGLDQVPPNWAPPSQIPHQQLRQQQHINPPPGLASRGMPPIPQQMFPPGFPGMGNFPPPEVMAGPRGIPPPGFFNGPPPGFIPPGFQGPEGMSFGGLFDGRGPPPQGAFRRQ